MMRSERLLLVTVAIWATASLMAPISPACTPQSIRMCFKSPAGVFRLNRKKSPKPTRYMRMRIPLGPTVPSAGVVDDPVPGEPVLEPPLVGLVELPLRGLAGARPRVFAFVVRFLGAARFFVAARFFTAARFFGAVFFAARLAFFAAMIKALRE